MNNMAGWAGLQLKNKKTKYLEITKSDIPNETTYSHNIPYFIVDLKKVPTYPANFNQPASRTCNKTRPEIYRTQLKLELWRVVCREPNMLEPFQLVYGLKYDVLFVLLQVNWMEGLVGS